MAEVWGGSLGTVVGEVTSGSFVGQQQGHAKIRPIANKCKTLNITGNLKSPNKSEPYRQKLFPPITFNSSTRDIYLQQPDLPTEELYT